MKFRGVEVFCKDCAAWEINKNGIQGICKRLPPSIPVNGSYIHPITYKEEGCLSFLEKEKESD